MKKKWMKLLSVLLAMSMLVTAIPVTGIASDSMAEQVVEVQEEPQQEEQKQEEPQQEEQKQEEPQQEEQKQEEPQQEEQKQEESQQEEQKQGESQQEGQNQQNTEGDQAPGSEQSENTDGQKGDGQNASGDITSGESSAPENKDKDAEADGKAAAETAPKTKSKKAPAKAPANEPAEKQKVTVTWSNTELTFNGASQAPTATADVEGVELVVSGAETDAGTDYTATADFANPEDANTYELEGATTSFKINPLPVDPVWFVDGDTTQKVAASSEREYDGNSHKLCVGYEDIEGNIVTNAETAEFTDASETPNELSATALTGNYKWNGEELPSGAFKITKKTVSVTWQINGKDTAQFETEYDGAEHKLIAVVKNKDTSLDEETYTTTYVDEDNTKFSNVGSYEATVTLLGTAAKNYKFEDGKDSFSQVYTIKKSSLTIALGSLSKTYGFWDGNFTEGDFEVTGWKGTVPEPDISVIRNEEKTGYYSSTTTVTYGEQGSANYVHFTLVRKDNSDACDGEHSIGIGEFESTNYKLENEDQKWPYDISPLEVQIIPDPASKYYREKDPETFAYTLDDLPEQEFALDKETICTDLGDAILVRDTADESGVGYEDPAGKYAFKLASEEVGNYKVSLKDDLEDAKKYFVIHPLPITVTPYDVEKYYGSSDAGAYLKGDESKEAIGIQKFSAEVILDDKDAYTGNGGYTDEELQLYLEEELGDLINRKNPGEDCGKYLLSVDYEKIGNNFKKVPAGKHYLTIIKLDIGEIGEIGSREGSFSLSLKNVDSSLINTDIAKYIQIKVKKWPYSKRIVFPKGIGNYITGADGLLDFGSGASAKISINNVNYSLNGHKGVKWPGKLPAGLQFAVQIIGENGKLVSNTKTFTVNKTKVDTPKWTASNSVKGTSPVLIKKSGSITAKTNNTEWLEIVYDGTKYTAGPSWTSSSLVSTGGRPVEQTAIARYVDTLNLIQTEASYSFIYDDEALPIASCQYENRGSTMTIQLSEPGQILDIQVANGTPSFTTDINESHTVSITFSGLNLITTGTPITVRYKDRADNERTDTFTTARSTVSTPITMQIRPALNANGFLNGQATSLIVSGSGCRCEPIRVTVADMSTSTYITQNPTWSDSSGTWEAVFDLTRLPDRTTFTITAEYLDVNGPGATMTVEYDSFCAKGDVVSPIFEAMSFVSGMAEPGTAVTLVYEGKAYEAKIDRFGHFVFDEVPSMFGGIDSFDIYVTDIAGNVAIRHYEVPEPGDPFVTAAELAPLGRFFYEPDKENPYTVVATPVSLEDLGENDKLEIPLLLGGSFVVGTVTVEKSGSGIRLVKQMNGDLNEADYTVSGEKLHVFTSRPDAAGLRERSNSKEYAYGDEIPLSTGEMIWIADDSRMEILAETAMGLETLDFENNRLYPMYQER